MNRVSQFLFVILISYAGISWANHDHHASTPATPATEISSFAPYIKECGSCHVPYPAAFLPTRSWEKLMANLAEHFENNAELAETTQAEITAYLIANSAEYTTDPRAEKFLNAIRPEITPLRLTEVSYFKKLHRMMPRMLVKMGKVKSLTQCDSCHDDTASGQFDENRIRVPVMCRHKSN
jgi:Dihaem cytochrome c